MNLSNNESSAFLNRLRLELAPLRTEVLESPFVERVRLGRVSESDLRRFAEQEYFIVNGDLRNIALTLTKTKDRYSLDFFMKMVNGERKALDNLLAFAAAINLTEQDLKQSRPITGCLAFTNFFGKLAMFGSPAQVSVEMEMTFDIWGANCLAVSDGLKEHFRLGDSELQFFTWWRDATYTQFLDEHCENIIVPSLESEPDLLREAGRLGVEYELEFWQSLT
jgi:thiaminase